MYLHYAICLISVHRGSFMTSLFCSWMRACVSPVLNTVQGAWITWDSSVITGTTEQPWIWVRFPKTASNVYFPKPPTGSEVHAVYWSTGSDGVLSGVKLPQREADCSVPTSVAIRPQHHVFLSQCLISTEKCLPCCNSSNHVRAQERE
jgi:hypothetical protein